MFKSNLIHCASKLEEKNILKLGKSLKTKVMPYGILNKFIKKKIEKKKINKKAIFFSRIHKKKGIENLINAWMKVNNSHWCLDIYGPVEDKKYLQQLKLSIKKNDNIRILNPIYDTNKKFKIFEKYDFMILPTFSENFGFIILESLARGLPVLTTKNTPWDDIKKKNLGWISSNSKLSLIKILKKIFYVSKKDNNYFYVKSKNAISYAHNFGWNLVSKQYVNVYKKLLNE